MLVEATATQGAFKPAYSPDGARIVFGCSDRVATKPCAWPTPTVTNVVIFVDDPGVNENHFSWGVAAE